MFWIASPPSKGDWTHIHSIDEFGAGHTDDCGPNANENGRACVEGRPPTYTSMDVIRSYDIAHGHFTPGGGQTINDVNWDLVNLAPVHPTRLWGFKQGFATYSAVELRAIFENSTPNTAYVVEVAAAHNLPNNEPNVNDHFVTVVGYDTDADPNMPKVLVCNGDREPLPTGTGRPDWLLLSELAGAQVIGLVAMLPVPSAPVDIAGAKADIATAQQALAHALVKLGG